MKCYQLQQRCVSNYASGAYAGVIHDYVASSSKFGKNIESTLIRDKNMDLVGQNILNIENLQDTDPPVPINKNECQVNIINKFSFVSSSIYYLFCEFRCFYFYKGSSDCLHIRTRIVEGNSSRSNWIFIFICINTCKTMDVHRRKSILTISYLHKQLHQTNRS